MSLDTLELVVRSLGASLLTGAVIYSAMGAIGGAGRATGRSIGLAGRMRARTVYMITAIPYFALCALLWRPLPLDLTEEARVVLLLTGAALALVGAAFYVLGRRELGSMYNVSTSFGSELYEGHAMVTTGPYALCHPM